MAEPETEPVTKSRAERRVFTEEFKRDAVRLAKERGNVTQVARDLGIHESVLTRWRRRLEAAPERPFPGHGNFISRATPRTRSWPSSSGRMPASRRTMRS